MRYAAGLGAERGKTTGAHCVKVSQDDQCELLGAHRQTAALGSALDMARVLGVSVEEVLGLKAPRKAASPAGRLGRTFEAVAKLPCRKQMKILEVVDALVNSA